MWEIKVFWKRNNKENTWEKLLDRYEIEEQKQISQNMVFFDFSKTLKQIKDKNFWLKNFF